MLSLLSSLSSSAFAVEVLSRSCLRPLTDPHSCCDRSDTDDGGLLYDVSLLTVTTELREAPVCAPILAMILNAVSEADRDFLLRGRFPCFMV